MDCRLPHPSPPPGGCSNSCPLSWWCHRTISSSAAVYSFCLSLSQHQGLFQWVSSSYQVAHLPKGTLKGKEGKRARVEPSWLILGSQCCLQNSVAKKKKRISLLICYPFLLTIFLGPCLQRENHSKSLTGIPPPFWGLTDFGVIQMAGFFKIFFKMQNYYNCPFPLNVVLISQFLFLHS